MNNIKMNNIEGCFYMKWEFAKYKNNVNLEVEAAVPLFSIYNSLRDTIWDFLC